MAKFFLSPAGPLDVPALGTVEKEAAPDKESTKAETAALLKCIVEVGK